MFKARNLLVPAIALALFGCNQEEAREPEIRPVRTVVVDPAPIQDDLSAVGEIQPRYESDLGFRVGGKLVERLVNVGDVVSVDQLLARIDSQDYANQLKSAQASVTSAQAALTEAEGNESRQRQLLENGTTTRANYDSALSNLNSAKAQLESAQASENLAADQLRYTEMHADFAGVVTATGAETGQIVGVGQMVVRLARPQDKDAIFSIAETGLKYKGSGPPTISVALLSDPTVTAEGVLREVSPVADPATGTFKVKVTLKDPPPQLRFGATIIGRLKSSTEPVIVLPGSALFDVDGKPAVWRFDAASGTVTLKPVTVSRYETDRVVVASGLDKGDVVVTAGVNRLRENQKVRLLDRDGQ